MIASVAVAVGRLEQAEQRLEAVVRVIRQGIRTAGAGIGLAVLLAIVAAAIPTVQDRLVAFFVARQVAADPAALKADGIRVILCGIAPPAPSPHARSCAAVVVGGRIFIVDAGTGSANNLDQWHFPMGRISAVLLTHFHSDHIGDLGEFRRLSWTAGRSAPLPVFGPDGVDTVVDGFNLAFAQDDEYRVALNGGALAAAPLMARPFGLADAADRRAHRARRVILDDGGLRITAFQVDHEPVYPAVGYRFDYKGRSVVFSGDTKPSPNLVAVARGADLLVHEAQSDELLAAVVHGLAEAGKINLAAQMRPIAKYHTTPRQAAQIANDAHARMLVFDHLGPIPPDNPLTRSIFLRGVATVRSADRWRLGAEGMVIDLPARSTRIYFSSVD